ncbi:MAG: hypothetical protein U5L45_14440 [Saprospiraceae bacterium]|nr:hypothetical protein [Saprospiraceae bacterium]
MVRFSDFARKTNHFSPFFASEASKKGYDKKVYSNLPSAYCSRSNGRRGG